jgi:hypothetical protein
MLATELAVTDLYSLVTWFMSRLADMEIEDPRHLNLFKADPSDPYYPRSARGECRYGFVSNSNAVGFTVRHEDGNVSMLTPDEIVGKIPDLKNRLEEFLLWNGHPACILCTSRDCAYCEEDL